MATDELAAIEAAYHALQPLNADARRRALQWLSAALDESRPLDSSPTESAAPQARVTVAATKPRPQGTRRREVAAKAMTAQKAKKTKPATVAPRRRPTKRDAASADGHRVYRRMPEAEVVIDAYQQSGTIVGLAEHFDVPLYTANHWARRLRDQGYHIGRRR
ncbi:MAG TPA: hypothetical protein VFC19_24460 [Candidatus Limnocylindrales bacterium]|nr:hypothetical protein [Candidatus Limnocylindrales bacterium]